MGKPFSPDRLINIRRMRKARRLFKKAPLFAYSYMKEGYPDYSYLQFLDDLRVRRPGKKKNVKSPLARYGRYAAMREFLRLYEQSKEISYAIKAQELRKNMTKPYRLLIRYKNLSRELEFSLLIPYAQIKELSDNINRCRSRAAIDKLVANFSKYPHSF